MKVSMLKSTGQQLSVVDNIRVQSIQTTDDVVNKDGMVTRGTVEKPVSRDYVMCSLGKGHPCQPINRNKVDSINVGNLVMAAYRNQTPMLLKLNF